jgi:hypothetical protein
MSTGGVGTREPRRRAQVLHDLLVQFGAGQDRQQPRRPQRRAIVAPAPAGAALAEVPCHAQPEGSRQHHHVPPTAVARIALMLSVSQYLPQFPAPRSTTRHVQGSFGGRERGDLEGAQDRLPVLTA